MNDKNNVERKLTSEDLMGLLHMRSRGGAPLPLKGKGSHRRNPKHKGYKEYE